MQRLIYFVVFFALPFAVVTGEWYGCQAVARHSAWLQLHKGYSSRLLGRSRAPVTSASSLGQRKEPSYVKPVSSQGPNWNNPTIHIENADLFGELKRWLIDNGASLDFHGLGLKAFPNADQADQACATEAADRRGLIALRPYHRGDLIARIPSYLHFSYEVLCQLARCVFGGPFEGCGTSGPNICTLGYAHTNDQNVRLALPLALFLGMQKAEWLPRNIEAPAGPPKTELTQIPLHRVYTGWLAYMGLLPGPPTTMPLFWTPEELRALNHPIGSAVFERLRRLQNIYSAFEPIMKDIFSTSFETLVDAYATVLSHSMKLPGSGKAFVPLLDLCSHSPHGGNSSLKRACSSAPQDVLPEQETPSIEHLWHGDGSVELVATREIPAGDEIRFSYGSFDNPTLILNYGILPLENPHEKISIDFCPRRVHFAMRSIGVDTMLLSDDFSFLGETRVTELAKLGLAPVPLGVAKARETTWPDYEPTVTVSGNSRPDERLLAAAKVLTADSESGGPVDGKQNINDDYPQQLSNEKAIRFVISFLQHALFEQFSTTEAEDSRVLRDRTVTTGTSCNGLQQEAALTCRMEMAIRFQAGRREVLRAAVARMQESINNLREK